MLLRLSTWQARQRGRASTATLLLFGTTVAILVTTAWLTLSRSSPPAAPAPAAPARPVLADPVPADPGRDADALRLSDLCGEAIVAKMPGLEPIPGTHLDVTYHSVSRRFTMAIPVRLADSFSAAHIGDVLCDVPREATHIGPVAVTKIRR